MTDDPDRHATKMKKKKAAREKIMAGKTEEKGLVIVHTGKGKGKSSAAFGMIFRAMARLSCPEGLEIAKLTRELEKLADDLMVELSFE